MTARRLDPSKLPGWPRFMPRELAAAYVGVSPSTFDYEVSIGRWPQGVLRGRGETLLTWDQVLLNQAGDAISGLCSNPEGSGMGGVDWGKSG